MGGLLTVMRHLKGVVKDTIGKEMIIKTEVGMVLKLRNKSGFKIGDKVDIAYDFTKNKVANVLPAKEEKVYKISPNGTEAQILDVSGLVLFGALSPGGDWGGCWDLETGADALSPVIDGRLMLWITESGYAGAEINQNYEMPY